MSIARAIPVEALVEAIDSSHDLVVATLPKSQRP
jgi:predicted DNA-binding protein (MmcQ/YjbR family)